MWEKLTSFLGRKASTGSARAGTEVDSRLRSLQMEMEERNNRLEGLGKEIERLRGGQERNASEAVSMEKEAFFSNASAPICQLLTQLHLVEVQKRAVETKDVLRLVKRLVRAFEEAGLEIQGAVGDRTSFDPNFHAPLSAEHSIRRGTTVTVRLPGLAYSESVLRKAGVEPAE